MKQILACACALVVLACLQRSEPVSGQLTPVCGLEGYDINTLSTASYWDIPVDKSQCLRPIGLPVTNISECHILFSICHPLPSTVCQTPVLSVSVCQAVKLTDGTTQYYVQGLYNTERKFFGNVNGTSYDGFFTSWNGTVINATHCEGNNSNALMEFQCNANAVWNPSNPTSAAVNATVQLGCENLITVKYSGACYAPPTIAPNVCQLPPFDIDRLSTGFDYWSAMVDPVHCIGTTPSSSCLMAFAFCHPLPPNVTTLDSPCTQEPTAVCQIDRESQQAQSFSLGMFSGESRFIAKKEEGLAGFLVEYFNGSTTAACPKGSRSKLTFNCDPNATWTNSDISQYTKVINLVVKGDCEIEVTFNYSGACVPVGPLCELPPFDIDRLSTGFDYWTAVVDPVHCIGSTPTSSCLMAFSFCHALPANVTTPGSPCTKEPTAACQIDAQSAQSFSLGMFSSKALFIAKDQQGVGGFYVNYTNGSTTTACPKGTTSSLVFNCDPNATWTDRDITKYTKVINTVGQGECVVVVNFNYSGACVPVGPIVGGRKISPVGWILMGIFFFVVLTYLLVGSLYQYFAVGARGVEILPNSAFWMNFGKLVLEGCTFSLGIISCHCFKDGGYSKVETQYDKI